MTHHRKSSLNGQSIADFDEFIHKKNSHMTLRSCLVALCFDPTTLIEIAVYLYLNMVKQEANFFKGRTQMCFGKVLWTAGD